MNPTRPDEPAIRKVESEVLDKQHASLRLIRRRTDLAIGHLLKAFGDSTRDLQHDRDPNKFRATRYKVNAMVYGLGHCLRWLLAEPIRSILQADDSWQTLGVEAAEFLRWGIQYGQLANDHTAWSHGLIDASFDGQAKRIVFYTPKAAESRYFVRQVEAQQTSVDARVHERPDRVLREDCMVWCKEMSTSPHGLRTPSRPRPSDVMDSVLEWFSATVLPAIPPSMDLGGFTLEQFRRVVAHLYVISLYQSWCEDAVDQVQGLTNQLGSQPWSMPKRRFIVWLSESTAVSPGATDVITRLLTFDPAEIHSRITCQPLIVTVDGTVLLSPRIVSLLDIERGLIGAMNRTGRKRIYDDLINTIERHHRRELLSDFRRVSNWATIDERDFKTGIEKVSPDFVAWESHTDRFLIADYKHALEPLGPVEVKSKMSELSKWIAKLKKYIAFFRRHPKLLTSAFPERRLDTNATEIDGMILTRWPLPLPVGEDESVAIADRGAFASLARSRPNLSFQDLLSWASTRPDVPCPLATRLIEQHISVEEWTYVRQTLTTNR